METLPAQGIAPLSPVDALIVRTWLHNRARNTALAYEADVRQLVAFAGKSLALIELQDLHAWDASMAAAAPASRARRLKSAKSVLAFAAEHKLIPADVGASLRVGKTAAVGQERILSPAEVQRLLTCETDPRLHALLRLLYVCGLRASEAADLRWKHVTSLPRKRYGLDVVGKGGKLRQIELPTDLRRELLDLAPAAGPETPLVCARNGGILDRADVWRALKRAGRLAAIGRPVSPHWLRHSHATHAIAKGCDLRILQKSMGHASIATTGGYLHVQAGESSSTFIEG